MSSAAGVVDLVDLDADGDSEEDEDENGCAGSVLGLSPKPAIKSKKGPEAAARQAGMVRKGLDLALSSSSEDEDNDDDEEEDDNDNDDIVRLGYTASQSKIENEADEEENERDEEDEESIQVLHAAASKLTTYAESLSSPTLLRGEAEVISLVTTEKKKTISRMATSPVSVLSVSPVVSPTRKRGRSTTDTLDDEDRGQSTARRFEQMPRAKLSSTVSFATSTFTSTVTSSTSSSSSSSSSLLSSPVLYNGAQTYGAGPQHAPAPPALKPEISEMNLEGLTKAEAREAMRKAKAEEKAKKKRHQAECKLGRWIKNGKHAQTEVVAVFSPRLAQTDQGRALQGMCIAEDIDFVVESGFRSSCMVTFAHRPFLKSTDNPDSAGFQLKNGITTKPEPVVDAKATPCLMSNAALLFWDADDFVMRLCRDLEGYASLEVVISSALADWTRIVTSGRPRSKFTKDQPKLIVVLRGANEAVLSAQKRAQAQKKTSQESADQLVNPDRTTQSALTDALSWLYVAYGCESRVLLNDQDKTNELFRDYAFAIMSALHYRPKTAVEVLAEFKGAGGRNADWGTNCERGEYVSHMWYLMLLCVLGDVGARRVLEEYPCLRSITDVYLDSTRHEHEKEQLLEDILSGSSSSAKFRKKSRALYRLFTTRDPHLLLK